MVDTSQKISNSPDAERMKALLNSSEGQALLRILQADGGAGLRAASEALRKGDQAGMQVALAPLLKGTEAEQLTKLLEKKL